MSRARGRSIIIFGDFGTGKTTLAAGAPKPLFLDTDKGTAVFKGRPGFADVGIIDINKSEQLEKAYANFQGITSKRWDKKYTTLVHDRFEDVQGMTLEEMNAEIVAKNPSRDIDGYDKKEWGRMGTRLRRYVRNMKALPIHKVFVCGQKANEMEVMVPALSGSLGRELPGLVDDVIYMRVGAKGRRFLHLHPTEEFYAKTRAWWLTPEEAKIRVPDPSKQPQFLSDLIARLIAGPDQSTSNQASEE
jgi:hypothetical protein